MHDYRKPMDSDEEDEEYADTGLPPLPTAPPPSLDLPPPPVAGRPPPRSPVPPPKSSPLPPTPPPKGESQTSLPQSSSGNSEFYIPTGSPIGSLKSPQLLSSDDASLLQSVPSEYEDSSAEILLQARSPKRHPKSPLPPPPLPPNKFKTSANTLPSESDLKPGVLLPKRAPKRFVKTHLPPPPPPPDYEPHAVPSTDDMLPTLSPKRSPKSPLPPVPTSPKEENDLSRASTPKSPLPSPPSCDKTALPSLPSENEPELVSSEHIRLQMRSPEKSKSPFPPPSTPPVENGPSVDTVSTEFELESNVLLPTRSPSKSPKSPPVPSPKGENIVSQRQKIVSQRPTPAPRLSIRNSSAPSLQYRPGEHSLNSLPESLSHSRSENLLGRLSAPDYDRPPLVRSSLRPSPPPPIGELKITSMHFPNYAVPMKHVFFWDILSRSFLKNNPYTYIFHSLSELR